MKQTTISRLDSDRDLRIDFIRGSALLVILIDHIEVLTRTKWLSNVTLHAFGPADALDVFVFLSGYVFGIVYEKQRVRSGLWGCQKKALSRAGQLYAANIAIYSLVLAGIWIFSVQQASFVRLMQWGYATSAPTRTLLYAALLMYQPFGLDILPLYIDLLLVMPAMLALRARHFWVAFLISAGLYLVSQFVAQFALPTYPMNGNGWPFNPVSWQLLFFIGLIASTSRESRFFKCLSDRWVVMCSGVAVLAIAIEHIGAKLGWPHTSYEIFRWTSKKTMGPLHLLYFLCLANVASACLPAGAPIWKTKAVRPIINCGQHSLTVFSFGVLLTYACVALWSVDALDRTLVGLLEIGAVAASIGLAAVVTSLLSARSIVAAWAPSCNDALAFRRTGDQRMQLQKLSIQAALKARSIACSINHLRGSAIALSILLLTIIGLVDYSTGKDTAFSLFYLVPIATSIWYGGRKTGVLFCLASAAIRCAVEIADACPIDKAVWNAGMRLGVYLVFCQLLIVIKSLRPARSVVSAFRRQTTLSISAALALALLGGLLPAHSSPNRLNPSLAAAMPVLPIQKTVNDRSPLGDLSDLVNSSMRTSRPVLLGSRDPNGPSCVRVSRSGDVVGNMPDSPGDLNGGPGTSFATIYYFDRREIKSPRQDFDWHQSRLKKFMENVSASNQLAGALAHSLAERTLEFWNTTNRWTELPDDIVAVGCTARDDWLNYCLTSLDEAVAARDLVATRRWAGELAAAAFSLDDLHRWLGFLVENHLTALEFQRQCESMFDSADRRHREYDPTATISQFPAGVVSLNGKGNYYEVERQAERLFSMPADHLKAISADQFLTSGSLWISPVQRETFLKLREALSDDNKKIWDEAARTPYQHSYLVNMLYRADSVSTEDELVKVLRKFDLMHPHAQVGELMNALMYRGHSFAGLEWGDRFRPELVAAADHIPASDTDLEAFRSAWRWTNDFYRAPARYGVTFTLRDALEQKQLDCVRATDMITSIFRNTGRVGMGNIRWCSETCGHSVAALMSSRSDKAFLGDGLVPPGAQEIWPDCYFQGHAWPAGLETNPQPYAAELYVRGLDGYVWAEGYIIRGPNAGSYTSVDVPYSSFHHRPYASKKIFDGPYPE